MGKGIFISATKRNIGKTFFIIGLIKLLKEKGFKVSYIKPVAQHYIEVNGDKISRDAYLMKKIFDFDADLKLMSPCILAPGITADFITGKWKPPLSKILNSYLELLEDSDFVLIEGTGHAGVGSVVKISNARVAKELNAKVVLIARGGIGSTIDEITLNSALFEKFDRKVEAIVINKILREKYTKIKNTLEKAFKDTGIYPIAFIPYEPILSSPTLSAIKEEVGASILTTYQDLDVHVDNVIVATMGAGEVLENIMNNNAKSLIITSGDRTDVILACCTLYYQGRRNIAGILLSSPPSRNVLKILEKINITVLYSKEDVYSLAAKVNNLTVKIHPHDKEKINLAWKLVQNFLDFEKFMEFTEKEEKVTVTFKWKATFYKVLHFLKKIFYFGR